MSNTQSEACCNTPAVVSHGYKEKGQWTEVAGMKTYTTGPSSAKQALLVVYDIFGFFPQTLQGADILAHADQEHQYQVYMPDFFDGKPADISWYPPDNKEKGEKLGEFFKTSAAPPKTLERIPKVIQEIQSKNSNIKEWGIVGYCWGGKIVSLSSGKNSAFKAAAAAHPAMVDPNDAKNVSIPFCLLPSKDEDKEAVEGFEKNLTVPHHLQWFDDQVHGFMAARGDLSQQNVKEKYEQGYKVLLDFFHKHM